MKVSERLGLSISKVSGNIEFIHGDAISDNVGAEMVVGHDLSLIKKADICVVGAREKIGAGTAQEIVIAKHFSKPVVTVIPKNTHYRKTGIIFHSVIMKDWIHPFLKLSSDYIAESIEDAADWINNYTQSPQKYVIKNFSVFEDAIKHFETSHTPKQF